MTAMLPPLDEVRKRRLHPLPLLRLGFSLAKTKKFLLRSVSPASCVSD